MRNQARRIVRSGGATGVRACAPVQRLAVLVRRDSRRHQREPETVRGERPRCRIVVRDTENSVRERGGEAQGLAAILEATGVNAVHRRIGILEGENNRVAHQHKEFSRREPCVVREREADAGGERKSGQINLRRAGVLEFEELHLVAVDETKLRRVEHDFREAQSAQILRRVKRGFDEYAPRRTVLHAGAHDGRCVDDERARVALRRG